MATPMHPDERAEIVKAARTLIDRAVLSKSLHGNISVRVPGTDHIVMTGSSLVALDDSKLGVIDFDDTVLDGHVAPTEFEVIAMHTAMYRERDDLQCVIHTHSPYASAFAVAGQPLPLVAESLARWGFTTDVPVATWAPRGSQESVSNIVDALHRQPGTPAVLLENHGVLVGGSDVNEAVRRSIALEEDAQLALLAQPIGPPKSLSPEQAASAAARRQQHLQTPAS